MLQGYSVQVFNEFGSSINEKMFVKKRVTFSGTPNIHLGVTSTTGFWFLYHIPCVLYFLIHLALAPYTLGTGHSWVIPTPVQVPICTDLTQTCQFTPIKSVTHAFDITHTLTRIHNSFTRIPPSLAARLKNSIMYTNLFTDASHVIDLPPVTSQVTYT